MFYIELTLGRVGRVDGLPKLYNYIHTYVCV